MSMTRLNQIAPYQEMTTPMTPSTILSLASLCLAACLGLSLPAAAMPGTRPDAAVTALTQPAAAVHRKTTVPGRGGPTVRRSTTVRAAPGARHGAVVVAPRPVVVAPGRWVRPYRWAPGGAIAAGAAIGFVAAASASAYYSAPPPQPGMCWYYTDPSKRNGFWDICP